MAPVFGPRLRHISQLIFFVFLLSFLDPLSFLEAEIPSVPQLHVLAVACAERRLLESCTGAAVGGGKPRCQVWSCSG